jgi:single-strand DNA-binding protein
MNQFNGIGNCGKDPEVRQVNENFKVATVSIGITESWKKDNERHEKTEWINLKFFNQLATLVEKYVHKGDKIRVTGKLQTTSWDKDGEKRYRTEVVVSDLQFLTPKKQDDSGLPESDIQPSKEEKAMTGAAGPSPDEIDDLPF